MESHQSDKKYLVYKDQIKQSISDERSALHSIYDPWFWSERIALIQGKHTDKFWHFQAFDIMTNEARSISFPKTRSHFIWVQIVPLAKNYGFIIESSGERYQSNLVKIHWKTSEIQVFERFERQQAYVMNILGDKMQPSKFVLKLGRTYEVCRLNDDGKIEFGDMHNLNYFQHYFNDKLFSFVSDENEDFVIRIYDLLSKKTQRFQIEELVGYYVRQWPAEWIKNRVYAVVESHDENKFGIAWTDLETKRFTLLDFTTTVRIRELSFFNGNLIAYGKESNEQNGILKSKAEIHSVPMQRPHSLRQMSWLLVVQKMKNSGENNPYKEASRFLPFNTDLRAPWFTDEAKGDQNEAGKDQSVMDESKNTDTDDAEDSSQHGANLNQREEESSQHEVPPKRQKPN